ncbi:hypothetical protein [Paraglaciecola sp.]|uniref:hypothetical protein n=1 Tax=Paraglaciecola sp. TaxID=1920173 RepID=UPI00326558F4
MIAPKKLEDLLQPLDKESFATLKDYFLKSFSIPKIEGEPLELTIERAQEQFSIDDIIGILGDVPKGFSDLLHVMDELIDPCSDIILFWISEYIVKNLNEPFFKQHKFALDKGSEVALEALVYQLVTHANNNNSVINNDLGAGISTLLKRLNGNVLKLITQAILSIHLGLEGAAKMQVQHSLEILVKKIKPYELQHSVIKASTIKSRAVESAKIGADKRWEANRKLKQEAHRLLEEMKSSGKFQNNSQASKLLTDKICQFAQSINSPFTDAFSAQRRIYDWFRAFK